MENRIDVKIYYEDTDSLGIVYYANYLKFLERGRTEWIDAQGKSIQQWNREGYNFAVYRLQIKFLQPARLGDICQVVTTSAGGSDFRKRMKQRLERSGEVITEAEVELVCLDQALKLREFPLGII